MRTVHGQPQCDSTRQVRTVAVRRDDRRWMELVFVDDAEFAQRRIELLKGKRK